MRFYWACVGEHIFKTRWEHSGNALGTNEKIRNCEAHATPLPPQTKTKTIGDLECILHALSIIDCNLFWQKCVNFFKNQSLIKNRQHD
jgi:hypothetical protein